MKLHRYEKLFLIFLFAHMLMGLLLSYINVPYYEGTWVREDGYIEWLSFDALLFAGLISIYRGIQLRKERSALFVGMLFFMGAVFIFGAGEEISWGQRIFNIESSEFFKKHNSQMETNLHNLILGGVKINRLFFGTLLGIVVGIYLFLVPTLYRKIEKVQKLFDRFAIPIPRWEQVITYIGIFLLSQVLIKAGKRGEMLEFGGTMGFLWMLLAPLNRKIYLKKKD